LRQECIEAVEQAIGRKLNQGEAENIEKRLVDNMAMIAKDDPQAWAGMSKTDRYAAAAEASAKQLIGDAQMRANRLALNITARAKIAQRFNDQVLKGTVGANAAERILNQTDAYIKGVQRENFSLMMDTINAAEPKFLGLMENPIAVRDFIYEVFGKKTDNPIAQKGVKAWLDTIEGMRQRFNRAGGDVGKLDYGYIPQSHDQAAVLKAGQDKWVAEIGSKLDRSRYMNDRGELLNDTEFTAMLNEVWHTLSTGGLNKLDPQKQTFGTSLANRGSKSRQLHFKDADAWMEYHKEFGKGTLFEAMQGHINSLARNIGVIEELGPNARAGFDMLNNMAIKHDGGVHSVGSAFAELESLYKVLTNENNHAVNPQIAKINQDLRNYAVAAKLQGTLISSITDIPTIITTARYHNLPIFHTLGNVIKSFGKDYREYANVTGLVADSIVSDMNRYAEGSFGQNWSSWLAHTTNKISLLNAWTDSLKRGFQISMMGALGKMKATEWTKLSKADRARLEFQGVSPEIYGVWQAATVENWRGSPMLTPQSIRNIPDEALFNMKSKGDIATIDPQKMRDEAVSRLLGFITDESEYAITTPDLTTRASLGGGTQKGTLSGEFMRHLTLFKSFPLAMANRHIRRAYAMNGETGSIGYKVSLMLGLIGFGALSIQLKSLKDGLDPADMTEPKFWGKAMMQGGGLGIYGDILYTGLGGNNRGGQPNYSSFAGPVFGTGIDLANVTLGNLGQTLRGERTNGGAELVRFTKQNAPFVNLWYAKGAIDHLLLQDIQESLSPGYLHKMKARAYKDFGQRYWWEPGGSPIEPLNHGGDFSPDRLPDFGNAIGD
jgi:vacuolar-type H+-ATPase subunit H